ncbi:hypothetical protein ACFVVM_32770 [Nocardia sp. NPDC058176]|uniref:hypothetical protein n=1 Tax=Nocardia sp. NPDC058176 TaxID=3346368 RepID=UPI0036D8F007
MTANRARKRANKARAAQQGGSYTAAHYSDDRGAGDPAILERMRLTGATPELAARMIDDARARSRNLADDDRSREADQVREAAAAVEEWEARRAGRLVRYWTVYVEARAAATDADEACERLAFFLRELYHHVPGIGCAAVEVPNPAPGRAYVAEVDADELSPQQRADLIADYPPAAWALRDQPDRPFGARETAHVHAYAAALERAAITLESGTDDPDPLLQVLPADTALRFWRALRSTAVLAGPDEASARRRGEQLAATVVDRRGRGVGKLVAVEPDDGFVSAIDERWVHPAEEIYWQEVEELWADYNLDQAVDHPTLQAATLRRAAEEVLTGWNAARTEYAHHEAKLHTQPDGSRTLSTPAEFARVAHQAALKAELLTAEQLRELAAEDDYMASRVYGKTVETDEDAKRVERLHHRATVLRDLADKKP